MKKYGYLFNIISIFFLAIFIPTLFCIFVWGNEMEYNLATKLVTLRDNKTLLLICVPILLCFMAFSYLTRKLKMSKKLSIITDVSLAMIFVGMFFINLEICKCLNLAQGWDVSCVVGTAYKLHHEIPIGDDGYYSLHPNNVPITFVLYKLFNLADSIESFSYAKDFIWVIVICIMVSVSGYFMCVSVKKITQNFAVTCISCFFMWRVFVLHLGKRYLIRICLL